MLHGRSLAGEPRNKRKPPFVSENTGVDRVLGGGKRVFYKQMRVRVNTFGIIFGRPIFNRIKIRVYVRLVS